MEKKRGQASNMKKNPIYIYIAAYLSLLIPTTGRFVYGLTLMLELFLLVLIGTLTISLIKKIKLQSLNSVVLMIVLTGFTILYRQIIVITYAEIALTMGLLFYLPTVSVFLVYCVTKGLDQPLPVRLKKNTLQSLLFCLAGILIFLLRDIAGYGTFTFFGKNHHIYEKILFNPDQIGVFSFIASIPGILVFSGLILFLQFVIKKMKILKNVENQK